MTGKESRKVIVQRGMLDIEKEIILVEEYFVSNEYHVFFRHTWVHDPSYLMYVSWDFPVTHIVHNLYDEKFVVSRDTTDDSWKEYVFDSMEELNSAYQRGEFDLV